MTDFALIERITRSLAYMLRHQPEQFDLELDPYGYAEIDEVVRALNERLGEPVEEEDLRAALASGDRERYEVDGDRIRALYGHSIDVEPGDPVKPPEWLYVGVSSRDADRAAQYGLRGGRRRFLHLALDEDDAVETGRRVSRDYAVITVRALEAWEEGINFYDRKSLFLSDPIPTRFLEVGDARHDGVGPQERTERGGGEPRGRGGRGRGGRRRREDREGDGPERRSASWEREEPAPERAAVPTRESRSEADDRPAFRAADAAVRGARRDRGADDRGPGRPRDAGARAPHRDRDRDRAERPAIRASEPVDHGAERGAERGPRRAGEDGGRHEQPRHRDSERGRDREHEPVGAGPRREDDRPRDGGRDGGRGGRPRDHDRDRGRPEDAEPRRERPAAAAPAPHRAEPRRPEPASTGGDFGLGVFEPPKRERERAPEPPAPRPEPRRPEPEPQPQPQPQPEPSRRDDRPGFGAGL